MKTTRYIYTALILAALSQGNAVAQNKGGFFSKVRDTFSTEIKIGNYTFKDGSVYTGEMKGRKPNGKGKTIFKNGDVYEGEYVKGKREGFGVYTFPDGERYEGQWYQDQQHYGKHPCHYLERYTRKQEDGHHQNTEQHWEKQQTREILQEDEEHPFAATHMVRSLQIYVVHTEKHRECHVDTQQHRHIEHQLLVGYPGRNLRLRLFDGKWPGHSHEEGYEHRDDHNLLHSVEGLLQHKTEANQYHHY